MHESSCSSPSLSIEGEACVADAFSSQQSRRQETMKHIDQTIETTESSGSAAADWLGLAGRVCVVTGAGSGIGARGGRGFVAVGAQVALIDRDGIGRAARGRSASPDAAAARWRSNATSPTRPQVKAAAAKVRAELGARACADQQRRAAAPRQPRVGVGRRVERGARGQPHRLPAVLARVRPRHARAQARQHRARGLGRRAAPADAQRLIQPEQGGGAAAVEADGGRMGPARACAATRSAPE